MHKPNMPRVLAHVQTRVLVYSKIDVVRKVVRGHNVSEETEHPIIEWAGPADARRLSEQCDVINRL